MFFDSLVSPHLEAASLPSRDDASTVGSRPPVVDGKAFFRSGFSVNSVGLNAKWFIVSFLFFRCVFS